MAAGQAQNQTCNRTALTPLRHHYSSTCFQFNRLFFLDHQIHYFCSYLVSGLVLQPSNCAAARLLRHLIKSCPFFLFHFLSAHPIDYLSLLPPSPLSVKSQYSQRGSGTSLGVAMEKKITWDAHNANMRDPETRWRDGHRWAAVMQE